VFAAMTNEHGALLLNRANQVAAFHATSS
jgi:hypothetical protein